MGKLPTYILAAYFVLAPATPVFADIREKTVQLYNQLTQTPQVLPNRPGVVPPEPYTRETTIDKRINGEAVKIKLKARALNVNGKPILEIIREGPEGIKGGYLETKFYDGAQVGSDGKLKTTGGVIDGRLDSVVSCNPAGCHDVDLSMSKTAVPLGYMFDKSINAFFKK